jgi:LemA protein
MTAGLVSAPPDPLATLREYRTLAPWGLRDLTALAGGILDASGVVPVNAAARARPSERTIRFYVARGLVSPPDGRGTAAVYSYRHLLQVLAIKLRQMEGATLETMTREFAGLTGDLIERRVAGVLGPALPRPDRLALLQTPGTGRGRVGRAVLGWLAPVEGAASPSPRASRCWWTNSTRSSASTATWPPSPKRSARRSPDWWRPSPLPQGSAMIATLILLAIVVLVVFWVVGAYNGLIGLRNRVANAWKQIDVQLKRRHDLIPNLVNTVRGAMDFERTTLEAVIAARNKAVNATGVAQTARAEGELTQALGRLFALTEAYPELKATGNVAQLQEELTSTENKIGFARQLYNDVATEYNTRQATFPTMLIAGLAKAAPAELWQITDDTERAVPTVDLSTTKPAP